MMFVLVIAWAGWFPTRDRLGEDEEEGVGTDTQSSAGIWGANWTGAGSGGLLGKVRKWFGRRKVRSVNVRMEGFSRA